MRLVDNRLTSLLWPAWLCVDDRHCSGNGKLHDRHLGACVAVFERFRDPRLVVPVRLAPNRPGLSQHIIRHPGDAGRDPFGCKLRLGAGVGRLRHRESWGPRQRRLELGRGGRRVRSLPGNDDMASNGDC